MKEIKKISWTLDEMKHLVDIEIHNVKDGFVGVGYFLKYIRDEKLWREGYISFDAFMAANYEKDKSWASRCISLYEQFGAVIGPMETPRLDERYADYNISQLIEMLSMPEERRTQITPEMKVKEIREMKPRRKKPESEKVATVATEEQREPEPETIIPEPQPDELVVDTSTCPPNNGSCRHQEWGAGPEAQKAGHKECVKCWEDWKKTQKVLNAAKVQQEEETSPEPDEEPAEPATEEKGMLEDGDPEVLSGDEPNPCPEETELKDASQSELEAEESLPEPETVQQDEEESLTDLQIARKELERAQAILSKCLKDVHDEGNIHIRGMKIKVCALASYVCDLDDIENPPPKPVQPELPLLKNNDQRAAFVDGYETWPLWIETVQTGERYYRYDLDDGTSMVVKVYHAMLFDYKAYETPYEERFSEGWGKQEYYLLRQGKFFKDCETNRSMLIEKLKEIQKSKKG